MLYTGKFYYEIHDVNVLKIAYKLNVTFCNNNFFM